MYCIIVCRMIQQGNKQWEIGFSVREASLDWNRQSHFITVTSSDKGHDSIDFFIVCFLSLLEYNLGRDVTTATSDNG